MNSQRHVTKCRDRLSFYASSAGGVAYRMQQLEKEYDTLKENDPAELQKATALTEVRCSLSQM